ncbi:uncharacterized protein [Argopecten irradians]|uniref:uncharacterized protein n=1 Tax=Argopecten irradians TaxID=31199 RepID=UPI0037152B56
MGENAPQRHNRSIGKIGQFDDSIESWETYVERTELYFTTNNIDGDVKVASFLTVIGAKTYGLLKNLCAPDKPADKTFDDIIVILKNHLCPKPSEIAERFRFHKRDQRSDESAMSYIAELRKLSIHCNFGDHLKTTLRDRFVCGLHKDNIQRRLLAETELNLETAVKTAVAMETASRDALELQHKRSEPVNKINSNTQRRGKGGNSNHNNQTSGATGGHMNKSTRTFKPCWR